MVSPRKRERAEREVVGELEREAEKGADYVIVLALVLATTLHARNSTLCTCCALGLGLVAFQEQLLYAPLGLTLGGSLVRSDISSDVFIRQLSSLPHIIDPK